MNLFMLKWHDSATTKQEQFYQVQASWNVVELSPDTCMACEVLGYSSLAPFEYLGKNWALERHS